MASKKLTPQEIRVVAAGACVDPRTVIRYLNGKRSHSTTGMAVERELKKFLSQRDAAAHG